MSEQPPGPEQKPEAEKSLNPAQWVLIGLVKGYRLTLSPLVGQHCRFVPTCSQYALEALEVHGALRGSVLTLRRIGRCNPWCEGGYDPVPPRDPPG